MNIQQIERQVVDMLTLKMTCGGWTMEPTFDLYDRYGPDETVLKFSQHLKSAETGCITKITHKVTLVFGNNGYDLIADHTMSYPFDMVPGDNFSTLMDELQEEIDFLEEHE